MKGKAAGLDECAVECLKNVSTSVIMWLVRLLNVCFVTSMVAIDWMIARLVSLNKGKSNKYECMWH